MPPVQSSAAVPPVPPVAPHATKKLKAPETLKAKKPKAGKGAGMPLMLIIAVLLVLALGGGAAWFLLCRNGTAARADGSTTGPTDEAAAPQTTVVEADEAGITSLDYPDDDPLGRERYVGTIDNGLPQDTAAAVYYRNGDLFRGRVEAGHLAAGTLFRPDGDFFRGTFEDDQPYNGHWFNENRQPIATVKEGITQ